MTIPASGRASALKRRSPRISLNSSVAVSGEDRSKCSFTVGAKATNLNKHGGAIQVSRELLVGTTVVVRNKRGTQLSARVVSQINAEQGLLRYGIEFVEEDPRAANFWVSPFLPTASQQANRNGDTVRFVIDSNRREFPTHSHSFSNSKNLNRTL